MCGGIYDIDNVELCTECARVFCYQCVWKLKKANDFDMDFRFICDRCGGRVGRI